jgi:hypothetical protein
MLCIRNIICFNPAKCLFLSQAGNKWISICKCHGLCFVQWFLDERWLFVLLILFMLLEVLTIDWWILSHMLLYSLYWSVFYTTLQQATMDFFFLNVVYIIILTMLAWFSDSCTKIDNSWKSYILQEIQDILWRCNLYDLGSDCIFWLYH